MKNLMICCLSTVNTVSTVSIKKKCIRRYYPNSESFRGRGRKRVIRLEIKSFFSLSYNNKNRGQSFTEIVPNF